MLNKGDGMNRAEKIAKSMKGNQNACKTADERMNARVMIRCHPNDLQRWKAEAASTGMKLNARVRQKLS